jgi:hypothetical protein
MLKGLQEVKALISLIIPLILVVFIVTKKLVVVMGKWEGVEKKGLLIPATLRKSILALTACIF